MNEREDNFIQQSPSPMFENAWSLSVTMMIPAYDYCHKYSSQMAGPICRRVGSNCLQP